jgi:hypothetical protein
LQITASSESDNAYRVNPQTDSAFIKDALDAIPNNRSITEAVETEFAPSKYFFSALRLIPTPSEYFLNRDTYCIF